MSLTSSNADFEVVPATECGGVLSEIVVTPEAKDALDRLSAEHGPLMFHITGGCCDAQSPICLPRGELIIGPRDMLIGYAGDVPVYEMESSLDCCCCNSTYKLLVVAGVPVGFSFPAGDMKRFAFREILSV